MRMTAWVIGLSMTLAITGCANKRVDNSFGDVVKRVPPGRTLYLTTIGGTRLSGHFAAASDSSLTLSLRDGSTRDFRPADLSEIRVKDPLWNGLLIGSAATGLAVAAINDESCVAPYAAPGCRRVSRGAGVVVGIAVGAGIGTAIDALHHRRVFQGTPVRPR